MTPKTIHFGTKVRSNGNESPNLVTLTKEDNFSAGFLKRDHHVPAEKVFLNLLLPKKGKKEKWSLSTTCARGQCYKTVVPFTSCMKY